MRPFTLRCAKVALFGFGLFLSSIIWLADAGRGQWLFGLAGLIPGGDKTGHFILSGLLAFLVNLVMLGKVIRCGRFAMLFGSTVVLMLVIAEEVSQLLFVNRTFEVLDAGADLAGIWAFGQLARLYLKRERVLALLSAASAPRRR